MPATTSQPKVNEFDLGPIRIQGCKFLKKSSTSGQYTLTLAIGDTSIDIVSSLMGQNVHVYRDGIELIEQLDDFV
jgi:hypothetical protein